MLAGEHDRSQMQKGRNCAVHMIDVQTWQLLRAEAGTWIPSGTGSFGTMYCEEDHSEQAISVLEAIRITAICGAHTNFEAVV